MKPLVKPLVRVLVFTPTYGDGPREETISSVKAQEFAGHFKHEVSRHNPFEGGDMRNILAQYRRGREIALKGKYDALLTVEHDMRLPPDALQKLWDTRAPVAYGIYVLRHGVAVINAWELSGSVNLGESLSLHRDRLERALKVGIVPVSGVGFGCTLIRRGVLEQIPFRSGDRGSEPPDVPFALDNLRANNLQVAHFGVLCGHWDGKRWLLPGGNPDQMTHVRANQNVTVRAGNETRALVAGTEYDLPDPDEVHELQRAGYVTVLERVSA